MNTIRLGVGCLLAALGAVAPAAADDIPVDIELVLAIDVSASIDAEQARLQRSGYASALTDDSVISKIRAGFFGRIAVTYVEWAAAQTTVVDWMIVEDAASARAFAAAAMAAPLVSGTATSISGAIDYAATLFEVNGFEGTRRVIDVSSDGRNSAGGPLTLVRREALEAGIVINGLPIIQRDTDGQPVDPGLERYYEENVIGGPGAFLVVAEGLDAFPDAIRRKLIIEIAGDWATPENCADVIAAKLLNMARN